MRREAKALLSEAEIRDELKMDAETLAFLKECSVMPGRNAASAIAAIKLRLEYSQPKPTQTVEHSGGLSIEIVKYDGGDDAGT